LSLQIKNGSSINFFKSIKILGFYFNRLIHIIIIFVNNFIKVYLI